MKIEALLGDITTENVDAIVNAANSGLRGGGGVDGAIHRAAGIKLAQACAEIGHCATGSAVITAGFELRCRYVIHTVGPVWQGGTQDEAQLLQSCYASSFHLALDHQLRSIAFPAISTGVYGYPSDQAAKIAIDCAKNQSEFDLIRFICFDQQTTDIYYELLCH